MPSSNLISASLKIAMLLDGGNDALDAAAKLADDSDGKPTKLSEEIRSLKK